VLQCVEFSMLQCIAMYCSVLCMGFLFHHGCDLILTDNIVLQCAAVCCSVLQILNAVCCSVLQCVAVCCGVLCIGLLFCRECDLTLTDNIVLQCVVVCCSVLQCVAVC